MLIAGNWKMNTDLTSAATLAAEVVAATAEVAGVDIAVCPPFVQLAAVQDALAGSQVRLGAQNVHFLDAGAYTGEVSAPMLKRVDCRYVILGHSERRQYFQETDELVNKKLCQTKSHGLIPIVCVGETLAEREAGRAEDVVRTQIVGGFDGVTFEQAAEVVIAYEPVWAIGTGVTATPEQAQDMHAFIRTVLADQFDEGFASDVHILYGGSMKPANAEALLRQPDINGGLIGGASLKADAFASIINQATAA